jgi:outer membrane protein assembly factor BamB
LLRRLKKNKLCVRPCRRCLDKYWSLPKLGGKTPAVANGVVYAGSSQGNLCAIDAVKGTLVWEAPISIGFSSPAVADGDIFVGATDGTFYALDAATGSRLWSYAHFKKNVAQWELQMGQFRTDTLTGIIGYRHQSA